MSPLTAHRTLVASSENPMRAAAKEGGMPEGKGKGSALSRTIFAVGRPNHVPSPMAGQGKEKGGEWIPGVGCINKGHLKGIPHVGKDSPVEPGERDVLGNAGSRIVDRMRGVALSRGHTGDQQDSEGNARGVHGGPLATVGGRPM